MIRNAFYEPTNARAMLRISYSTANAAEDQVGALHLHSIISGRAFVGGVFPSATLPTTQNPTFANSFFRDWISMSTHGRRDPKKKRTTHASPLALLFVRVASST